MEIVTKARFDGKFDPDIVLEISKVPKLYDGWRDAYLKKSDIDYSEDQNPRLRGNYRTRSLIPA